jgi:hypothetical protein
VLAAIVVAPGTFLVIVGCSAVAGTLAALAGGRGVVVPVVVLELLLGILVGPEVLGLHVTQLVSFFADLGLGLLFFFAGYEIDVRRISGEPLRLGLLGWGLSLLLAYAVGGLLALTGVVLSLLYTGSALATTAIGTLIPILSDAGDLRTRFGTFLMAAGAVGEFGPILLLTLILSTQSTLHNAVILVAFIALAVGVALFAVRSSERTLPMLERTLESSSQLAVRWILVLVFFVLFLVVRGTPALVLYRGVLDARKRAALALMCSTQLPLVLAITTLASATGHMRASTAAALVGAAVLSTLVFPTVGLRLRGDIRSDGSEPRAELAPAGSS